jgi:hypothetical protein
MKNINDKEKEIFELKIKKSEGINDYNSNEKSNSILASKNSLKKRYLSNTVQNFNRITRLTTTSQYKGLLNKKFNLTKYKNSNEKTFNLSHSLEKFIKPHKLRGNGIPNDILERVKLFKNIFFSEKFKTFYDKRPMNKDTTFEEVINYIVNFRKKNSELESAMMAYYFVCHEIKYLKNHQNITMKNLKNTQKPENVFESKRALSIGFTNFFEYLLKKMEIKYKHIEGNCKLIPKNNSKFIINTNLNINTKINSYSQEKEKEKEIKNDTSFINHSWDAIYVNREWYFVDTLLGSGGIDYIEIKNQKHHDEENDSEFDFNFNPYYFMIPPNNLIITHRPNEDLWQFTEKTITLKQFINSDIDDYSPFYKGIYLNNIEFLTHNYPLIKISSKDTLIIKLRLKKHLLGGDLYASKGKQKLSEVKYAYDESTEIYTFEPTFPSNGDFIIRITSRSLSSTDLVYLPLIDYIIKVQDIINFSYFDKYNVRLKTISGTKDINKEIMLPKLNKTLNNNFYQTKIITDYLKVFPTKKNKKICYDNEGFNLIEPKTNYLKKGTIVKFKIRMKSAASIAILDGNKLFHLKKTERNTYEGEKEIKTDNVCICCLRGKNVFTEVYRFKQFKEKSVDSKMFLIKIKKRKIF